MESEDSTWCEEGRGGNNSIFSEPDDLNLGKINGIIFRQFTVPPEPCGSTEVGLPASFAHLYRIPVIRHERTLREYVGQL